MSIKRTIWKNQFKRNEIPEWNCPTCKKGILKSNEKNFSIKEDSSTIKHRGSEDWEEFWRNGIFCGTLKCNNSSCYENVAIIGEMSVVEESYYLEEIGDMIESYSELLKPKLFIPSLEIFALHEFIPKNIKTQINEAFSLFFVDNSSCANKIRVVVELIMDEFKIQKVTTGNDRKRRKLQLHHRIEKFKIKYPTEGEFLMAIKWIGNAGSHYLESLTKDDTLDGFEMLEHVIYKLYEIETKKLNSLKKKINQRKGIIKKR
jgi:hypothetical protein